MFIHIWETEREERKRESENERRDVDLAGPPVHEVVHVRGVCPAQRAPLFVFNRRISFYIQHTHVNTYMQRERGREGERGRGRGREREKKTGLSYASLSYYALIRQRWRSAIKAIKNVPLKTHTRGHGSHNHEHAAAASHEVVARAIRPWCVCVWVCVWWKYLNTYTNKQYTCMYVL